MNTRTNTHKSTARRTRLTTLATLALTPALCLSVSAQSRMAGMEQSRFGGPVYTGAPALAVTASLVKAGGGPKGFSIATALTAMVGPQLVQGEVQKLTKQYGKSSVDSWITVFNFAVSDALAKAIAAGVTLPEATLAGKPLAATLVTAGMDDHQTFYTEYLLDKAVTHAIHMAVMDDIEKKYGVAADVNYHKVTNQALVDIAHALGQNTVRVADLH